MKVESLTKKIFDEKYNFSKNVLKVDFWQKNDLKSFEKVETTKQYKQEKTVVLCAPISSGLVLPLFWIIFLSLVVFTAYILRLFPCLSEWMDLYSLKSNPNNMSSFLMNSGSYMDPKFLTGEDYAQANYAHHSPGDYYSHQVNLPANNLTLVIIMHHKIISIMWGFWVMHSAISFQNKFTVLKT